MTGEIGLQDDVFQRARCDIVESHDALLRGRDHLTGAALQLFADGWRGVAADQYAAAWDEWAEGAGRVLRSLLELTAAMSFARAELSSSDIDAGHAAAYLEARLGVRP